MTNCSEVNTSAAAQHPSPSLNKQLCLFAALFPESHQFKHRELQGQVCYVDVHLSIYLSVVYWRLCRCASLFCLSVPAHTRVHMCVCEGVCVLDQRLKRFSPQQRDDQQGQGRLCGNTNCSARKSFLLRGHADHLVPLLKLFTV